jgi:hypothetical protein
VTLLHLYDPIDSSNPQRARRDGETEADMGRFYDAIRAKIPQETKAPRKPTTANTSVMENRRAAKAMKGTQHS